MNSTRICFSLAICAGLLGVGCSVVNDVDSYSSGGQNPDASTCNCPDDQNPCTKELCENGACVHKAVDNKTSCAGGACFEGACCKGCWDGKACKTGSDTGACGANGVECKSCDDQNDCTQDSCEQQACKSFKLTGDKCSGGVCSDGICECGKEGEPCCANQQCGEAVLVCKDGTCGTCGAAGQVCCSGGKCGPGNSCNLSSGVCEKCGSPGDACCNGTCQSGGMCVADKCQACGTVGAACCTAGKACASDAAICDTKSNTCADCGSANQLCCASSSCNTNNYCSDQNKCLPCGVAGEVCCKSPAQACDSKSVCQGNNYCAACGAQDQPCCNNNACGSPSLVCSSEKLCRTCGTKGNLCCSGNTCTGVNVTCEADNCVDCGHDGQACCSTAPACANGASCKSGKCVSCVVQIEAGDTFTCARKADGNVVCWGLNENGQLGFTSTGTTKYSTVPVTVPGLPLPAIDISAGGYHACAILSDSSLWCWGRNDWGQVGVGSSGGKEIPPTKITALDAVSAVSVGWYHTCAIRKSDKQAYCWGQNVGPNTASQYYQLGIGTETTIYPAPTAIPGMTDIVAIGAGSKNSCFVKSTGETYCAGVGSEGTLGNGKTDLSKTPTIVGGTVANFKLKSITIGSQHACGISLDGATTYCWGGNSRGQVGNNTSNHPITNPTPVQIGAVNAKFVQIAASPWSICAKTDTNAAYCWGENTKGQAGTGKLDPPYVLTPTPVLGDANVSVVAAGFGHACFLRADHSLGCYGDNAKGQLGDGSTTSAVTQASSTYPACN